MTVRRRFGIAGAVCFLFAAVAAAQYRIDFVDTSTVLQEDKAHPEMTWYWPSFWQTPDGALHFLAHGGDGAAAANIFDPPDKYRCGFKEPGIDSFYGADFVNGQWQTPADESCPAFWGEYERCGYTPQRTESLEPCPPEAQAHGLCGQKYAPIGPVGSPSILRIERNGVTRTFMAYSGGNGDYIPGRIYWAEQDNGAWKKLEVNGDKGVLYSQYWNCEWTFDPVKVVKKTVGEVCSRRSPGTDHGLTTVDIVYDENDRGSGANADGTIYFFVGYDHKYSHKLNPTDDPKACPPECPTNCGYVARFDSLVYRVNYDPTSTTGLGSRREIFMYDAVSDQKKWMPHSGALVWDYDIEEFGEAPTADPLCYPQKSTNIWPGNIDVKWNPDTGRWLSIGYFGETELASISNHRTQENTSLWDADNWKGGPLSQHNNRVIDKYETVEISELTKAFPSNYYVKDDKGNIVYDANGNPKITYIGYGGGLWYGTLGGKSGMWYFVPVRKKIYGPNTGAFVGLAIVPTLLKQCAYTMPFLRDARVDVSSDKPLSFTVTASSQSCGWTVESAPWIHSSVSSAVGTQTVTFTIDPTLTPREGSVSVAGRHLIFVQNPCPEVKFTVTPVLIPAPATRSLQTVQVAATANCRWTAQAVTPGITFDGPAEGVGSGTLRFYVEPNGGLARTLTLQVAGIYVSIRQAEGCAFSINPSSAYLGEEGGTTLADILASDAACTWKATSDAGFVSFPLGSTGTGSGQLRYIVSRNTGAARTARISVGNTSGSAGAYVNQSGQGPLQCPAIMIQPTSIAVEEGQDADIRYYATGTNLSFSWIVDGREDSTPSDQYVLRGVRQSHTLQGKVSNACTTAFTDIVTVSVVPSSARCALPEIYLGPDTLVQPSPGYRLPMSITARHGDPGNTSEIKYQWYVGQSGDTRAKIDGLTSSSFNDAPINTTFYWATATDSCGTQHSLTGAIITPKFRRKRPAVRHDFSGDDKPDLLWRNYTTGENQVWVMNGTQQQTAIPLLPNPNLDEQIQSIGDLNGDEQPDLVWRNTETGENTVWLMNGPSRAGMDVLETRSDRRWSIGATADFDGDDVDDVVWHNDVTGENEIWFQDGVRHVGTWTLDPNPDSNWKLNGTADFNGDQKPDLFFRNYNTGANTAWLMDGARAFARIDLPMTTAAVPPKKLIAMSQSNIEPLPDTQWIAQELSDFDGDGSPDITWRHAATAQTMAWKMSGTTHNGNLTMPQLTDPHWQLQGGGGRTAVPGRPSEPRTATSIAATAAVATPNVATIVTARLTSAGTPLAGRTLEFRLNGTLAAQVLTEADGNAVAAVGVGTLGVGTHPGAVTVTFAGDVDYAPATTPVDVTVGSLHPTIVWPAPAPIVYGTLLGAAQLNATADVAGTFAYAPPAGTVLDAGAQTLSVTFTPSVPGYDSATASVTLTVVKATPNIVWPQPSPIVYGTPLGAAQLNAQVDGGGAVTYSPAAGTLLDAGTHTLTATVAPTANTNGATASQTLVVTKAKPAVSWSTPAAITYPTPLGAAQLNATANVAGAFSYTPPAGTILGAGNAQTLTVRFTPSDARNYDDATASVAIDVLKATQTIVWSAPAPIVYGTPLDATQLNAAVHVAGPAPAGAFTYVPPAGTILEAGPAQALRVTAAETANYLAASATVTIDVTRAKPLLSWAKPAGIVYGTPLDATQLNATANVAGTFTYTPAAGTLLDAGAGQTLSVRFTPADARNYEDASAATTIDVARAKPVLSWPKPAGIVYGTPLDATQLNATANVAGAFAYTPAAGTILNAGAAQTLSVHFTPADTRNYEDATAATTIDVAKAKQTLAWATPSPIVYGTALGAGQLNAHVSVVGPATAGELVYAPPAGTVLDSGAAQTLRVTALETANYEAATASVPLDVLRAPLAARAADQSKLYGAPLPPLTGTLTGVVNGDAITATYSTAATVGSPTGTYAIAVVLSDPNGRLRNYDVTLTPGTLTVGPAPLFIAADPASKQYSDPLPPLTASFRGFVLGETPAVLGGTLSLQTTATTLSAPGTYPIAVGGLTSSNYAITTIAGTLTVTAEDARATLTSPLLQAVSGSGRVTLAATVKDISATPDAAGDTDAGDIRKATLTFVDRGTDATLCTAPIALLTPDDTRVGVATCTFTGVSGTLKIGMKIGGYYTRNDAADDAILTLVPPTDDFVTGGGSVTLSSSAGTYAADPNDSARFTINLQYDKNGAVKGDFRLTFVHAQRTYELTDLTAASLTVERTAGGGKVAFVANATLRDITSASAPAVVAEGIPLVVTLTDDGEPATRDTLSAVLLNPSGGLYFAAAWNGTRSIEAPLHEGNIAVHAGH